MKAKRPKLRVSKQTLRNLSPEELYHARGGKAEEAAEADTYSCVIEVSIQPD